MTTEYAITYAVSEKASWSERYLLRRQGLVQPLRQSQFYQFILQRKVDRRP